MISVEHLSFGYKRNQTVLHDITFSLPEGIVLLIGKNGSGKSTLIKLLTCALPANAEICIDGQPADEKLRRQCMAYLPQEFDVYPSLKVSELLRFVAKAKGLSRGEMDHAIRCAAEQTHIEEYMNKKVKQCSVGTRRRVGIAATLLGDPAIVVLDEPTAGIDPQERVHFYRMIRDSFAGKTVIIATHILDDMEILAHHVLMMSKGRLVYNGDYHDFRHCLDNRLYEMQRDKLEQAETPYMMLGETLRDGKEWRRVVFDGEAPEEAERIASTSEDVWSYYERGQSNAAG